jgi:ABC-type antimicrobial peptide transport system permease subunit
MPIIGVVADAKNRSLTEDPRPELYLPGLGTYSTFAFRTEITLVARGRDGGAAALAAPIRRVIAAAAPDVAVYAVATLGDIVRDARAGMTIATRLMVGYAVAALLLALAGTYAVLSYLVTQRRREMALRIALGASPAAILGMVARESALLTGIGVLAGLAGAFATARLLAGLLYGVGGFDAAAALVVALGAALVGILAAIVPARRAARVDVSTALRAGL